MKMSCGEKDSIPMRIINPTKTMYVLYCVFNHRHTEFILRGKRDQSCFVFMVLEQAVFPLHCWQYPSSLDE